MNCASAMEWNPKPQLPWDWENLIMYNPNPRKLDGSLDWEFDDGVREAADFGACCNANNNSGSISELGFAAAAAGSSLSSNSAYNITTSSSTGNPKPNHNTGEPLIALKLGKRTYFEDSSRGSNCKTATPATATTAAGNLAKRSKSNCAAVFCQVEGCNLDLSAAKDYHKKHRVCEGHSKCPKVVVAGVERRFCQQCSRFHSLAEFDEKKRSCRKRLSDHNARRRKPQGESLRFNYPSTMHSSSIYDERQRKNFGWGSSSRSPLLVQGRALDDGDDDVTRDLHRALSLLSTNLSWGGSCQQQQQRSSVEAADHTSPAAASVPESFFQVPHIELQSAEPQLHSSQSAYVGEYCSQQSQTTSALSPSQL